MKSYQEVVKLLGNKMLGNYLSGRWWWEGVPTSIIAEIFQKQQKEVDRDVYTTFELIKSNHYSKTKAKQ